MSEKQPGVTEPDPLFQVTLSLAKELWVVKDRQAVLEEVLGQKGIDVAEAVDTHQPSPELAAKLDEERKRWLSDLIAPYREPLE